MGGEERKGTTMKVSTMKAHNKRAVRIIAVVMALIMAFGLAACGNSGGSSSGGSGAGGEKSMEEILLAAAKNMEEAESMTYTMDMEMGMSVFGISVDSLMNADVKTITSPLQMEMVGTMDMGDLGGEYGLMIYGADVDGEYTMYTGTEYEGETMWVKTALDADSNEISQYNAQSNISVYIDNADNFTEVGTEEVNGADAVRFDGTISGDSIGKVLEESGMTNQMGVVDLDEMADLYNDVGDIPVSFWVDTEKELIVKYTVDMSEAIQSMMTKLMEQEVDTEGEEGDDYTDLAGMFSISKSIVTMTITGINNVDSIEIPQEAIDNAEEIEY